MATRSAPVLYNSADQKIFSLKELRDIREFFHLLLNLVQRDITVRYKRSILGFFWTMLHPLLLMIILTIVFSTVFRFDSIRRYEIYFLSEYLCFLFFVQTTVTSMTSLAWNGSLMKRVRVPKSIFALSTTLSGLVNLALSYIPLFAIMLARGVPIRATVLFLPLTFLILAVFAFGVSLVLSSLAVYFDDVSHMYGVAATGLMYMTPIIYPISIVPEKWLWLVKVNPLTTMLELARMPLYDGVIPPAEIIGISTAIAVGSLLVGWVVFHRLARGFYLHI